MDLLTPNQDRPFKPFQYPWAFEFWKRQQATHWIPDEVPMADDVLDWEKKLEPAEKNLLTQIFRFFTQADVEVADCYHRNYLTAFKPTEVIMMLTAFANMETIHVASYSHLLETVGMPEEEYLTFLKYKEMKDKQDFMQSYNPDNPIGLLQTLGVFGGFIEGLSLFASFAMLMNFPRYGKMKGMGQIVSFSVRDETLHMEGIIRLFHALKAELKLTSREEYALAEYLQQQCVAVVEQEDYFIDLAFELGEIKGMTPGDIKMYIRYIADQRLEALGCLGLFDITQNPLPWLEPLLNAPEHANFFEQRSTEYSKGALTGSWGDVF